MLPCGNRLAIDASFAPPQFPINMERLTSQKARDSMAIEKCINEFDVGDVIFEEGSGASYSWCSKAKSTSSRSTAPARL
jgi:hypothetical protein